MVKSSQYLYHMKPLDMRGTSLMPLSSLKIEYPKLFEEAARKYIGREVIMNEKVFPLNCFWNDVIHFSPIHPSVIFNALEQLGGNPKKLLLWFKIPWSDQNNIHE